MFTWISNSCRAGALAVILPLAGCMGEGTTEGEIGFLPPADAAKPAPGKVLSKVALYNGKVVVAGPRGYCVDAASLKKAVSGSFALIASCEVLSGKPGTSVDPAVMTVTVMPRRLNAIQPTAAELAASMDHAKALVSEDGDGISLVRLDSGGDVLLPGGDPRYWRAGMLINGHIVSLAAYTPKGSDQSGHSLILALAETLREQSPVKDYTPVSKKTEPKPETEPKGLATLLGGLFPE